VSILYREGEELEQPMKTTSWEGWQGRLGGSNKQGRVASGNLDASP